MKTYLRLGQVVLASGPLFTSESSKKYSDLAWTLTLKPFGTCHLCKSVHLLNCILVSPLWKKELKITMNAFQFIFRAFRSMVIWVNYFFFIKQLVDLNCAVSYSILLVNSPYKTETATSRTWKFCKFYLRNVFSVPVIKLGQVFSNWSVFLAVLVSARSFTSPYH